MSVGWRVAGASLTYCLAMLAAGWCLGPIRVLLVEPRSGPVVAVWLEAPFMLSVILLSARWASRRFRLAGDVPARLSTGLTALGLVLVAELVGNLGLRNRGPVETLQSLMSIAGLPTLALYLVALLAPWLTGGAITTAAPHAREKQSP